MGTLIPLLVQALPGIISGVEALFGAGNGAAKKVTATQQVQTAVTNMANSGVIPKGTTIDPTQLETLIETFVAQMNQSGGSATPTTPKTPTPTGLSITYRGVVVNLD